MRQNFIAINTIKHTVCFCSCIPEFVTDFNFHLYHCMTTRKNTAYEWAATDELIELGLSCLLYVAVPNVN